MTVIWCVVPQIWSAMDRIFCHFGCFLPFYPPNNPKNQNFEKMKKTPGDIYIIILHMRTINDNHMMYGSWDEHDGQNFLSFWNLFFFYPPNNPKNQNSKMKKTPWDMIILHMCTINNNHMMYGSWDMEHDECDERDGQNFLPFWNFFFFLPS